MRDVCSQSRCKHERHKWQRPTNLSKPMPCKLTPAISRQPKGRRHIKSITASCHSNNIIVSCWKPPQKRKLSISGSLCSSGRDNHLNARVALLRHVAKHSATEIQKRRLDPKLLTSGGETKQTRKVLQRSSDCAQSRLTAWSGHMGQCLNIPSVLKGMH